MEPFGGLIATILMGTGLLISYAALKNRRVLGRDGILAQVLSKGTLNVEPAVIDAAVPPGSSVTVGGSRSDGVDLPPITVQIALESIRKKDPALASAIIAEIDTVQKDGGSPAQLDTLLRMAEAAGFRTEVSRIRKWVANGE